MIIETVVKNVKNRIIKHGRGWCFTPKHFLDLDSDTGVRSALSRLQKDKFIRRLAQGIYEYPREHSELGTLPPKAEAIAKAIAEKNGIQIQPSGAYAANLIGLSEQVPGRIVFLTNGPSKKIKIGRQEILFRTTTEKNMHPAGTKVGLVVQAFRNLGKDNIDKIICSRTKKFLTGTSKQELVKNLKYAPQWIRTLIFNIMEIVP
jgi:predicted transcriptional regulator of viral defense system